MSERATAAGTRDPAGRARRVARRACTPGSTARDGGRRAHRRGQRSSSSRSSSPPPTSTSCRRSGSPTIGENRDQEASAKVRRARPPRPPPVHFVGQLQSNKAASVARYADVVQSVDRARLVRALDRARLGRPAAGSTSPSRSGSTRPRAGAGSRPTGRGRSPTSSPGRRRCGCAASWRWPRSAPTPRAAFARLREVGDGIRADHPGATWISAGMSGDLEAAVAEGATHLRVGSAILGSRQSHR